MEVDRYETLRSAAGESPRFVVFLGLPTDTDGLESAAAESFISQHYGRWLRLGGPPETTGHKPAAVRFPTWNVLTPAAPREIARRVSLGCDSYTSRPVRPLGHRVALAGRARLAARKRLDIRRTGLALQRTSALAWASRLVLVGAVSATGGTALGCSRSQPPALLRMSARGLVSRVALALVAAVSATGSTAVGCSDSQHSALLRVCVRAGSFRGSRWR
jgi:hypothetical protein